MRASGYLGEPTPFLRWLGCWRREKGSLEFNWGQLCYDRLGFALSLCSFESHFSLHLHILWLNLWLRLSFLQRWHTEPRDDPMYTWGFSFFDSTIHLNCRHRCKIIHLPWDWSFVSHHVWISDPVSSWVIPANHEYSLPYSDGRHTETHPYTYVLKNGSIQHRIADIYGERREWRWLWFKWLPWPKMVRRTISVNFSDEVGERSGSWKGGTIGCGYEWREGETMLAALRRMEAERKF